MNEKPLEDWEYPEPDSDDGDAETLPCPHCGEDVYEDAVRCPFCDADLDGNLATTAFSGRPIWYILLALAGIYAFLEVFVLP